MNTQKRKPDVSRFGVDGADLTIRRNGKVVRAARGKKSAPTKTDMATGSVWSVELAKGDHSSATHPWPADKPGQNWIEKKGGKLPPFMVRVAKHIMADSGYTQSHAIASAINQCKKGRLGAKGLAAAAQWEALKAS